MRAGVQPAAPSSRPGTSTRMMLDHFLDGVRRTVLPNGLTLLTREERRGGVVSIVTWVRAGYFHEPDEKAGMAHLFEHMFFKGSRQFPGAEEIAQHVSRLGGVTNAGTIYDSTSYYFVLPREGFTRGVEIQADAVMHPLFDPEELRKECEVVIEESNRKLDNPSAVATERMFATAFTEHRMKRWRIGSNDVLRNIDRDDLIAFFDTLYRPENIIVSIAGDVSHEEAIETVTRAFGALERGTLIKERGPVEPPQTSFRFAESRGDIKQALTVLGWHVPGEGSEDDEALDVLSAILGSGKYSRLYRGVVGAGGANSVSASHSVFEDVGVFTIRGSADDPDLPEVEARILSEVAAMREHGPSEFEIGLARNRVEAAFVFELEETLGQAQTLAWYESRGGYEQLRTHVQRLEAVTAEQVRDVARRYLTTENLTLYRYRPHGVPEADLQLVEAHVREAAKRPRATALTDEPPVRSTDTVRAATSDGLRRFVLSNGATLFVQQNPGTPTVSLSVIFRGGRIDESSRNAGITQLMCRSMRRATASRSYERINREIEYLGTQLDVSVDEDFVGFSIDVLRKYLDPAAEILADVLLHPAFPAEGIEEERRLQAAGIRRSHDSATERPFQLFHGAFYGSHPYANPGAGFESTLEMLDRDALVAWYRGLVRSDAAVIVAVGDVDAEHVHTLCESLLGGMRPSDVLRVPPPTLRAPSAPTTVIESRDRMQSAIVVGFPSVPPAHDDWVPLKVLGSVTSGLAGTFFAELRGRRSLAYTVYAGEATRALGGAFVAYIASDAAKEQEALEGLVGELRRLSTDGFTDDDVERARSYIRGTTRIRLQTNSAIAGELAEKYLYGLGLDFTERFLDRVAVVTAGELRTVAAKYLSTDNYVTAILRGRTQPSGGSDGRINRTP